MDLEAIQQALREQGLDGWLFYDFDHRDPIAYRILGLAPGSLAKRRWYYLLPAQGSPKKLVHRIENGQLDSLPGEKREYAAWEALTRNLQEMLAPFPAIAMQYSPNNQIPYISRADAGTVELIRGFGNRVVSSADLVQRFEARWTDAALESHLEAGRRIDGIIARTFKEIGRRVGGDGGTDEYAVQQFLLKEFEKENLVSDDRPLVAVNRNSGNAHYDTRCERTAPIRAGDFVLLDVWAKLRQPGAVYYDVTWVGFSGRAPVGGASPGVRNRDGSSRPGGCAGPGSGPGRKAYSRLGDRPGGARLDCGKRVRRLLCASHGPFDWRIGSRKRRKHR